MRKLYTFFIHWVKINCKYWNIAFDHLQNFPWLWNFNCCFLLYSFQAIPVTRLQLKTLISIIHNSLDLCPFGSRSDYIRIHGILIRRIKQVAFSFCLLLHSCFLLYSNHISDVLWARIKLIRVVARWIQHILFNKSFQLTSLPSILFRLINFFNF